MAAMSSTPSTPSWPPSCLSAPSNCTCCCILTPHTHLSDSAGYPHLNHIIRFPQPGTDAEALAWFHCPHCPCTLGINWIHPQEMSVVEESVSNATWLPRVADFEGYVRLFDDGSGSNSVPQSPMGSESMILVDKMNETNVSESTSKTGTKTPVVHRKPPISDQAGTRKSARKSKRNSGRLDDWLKELATPTYKPRKSKYDIR